MDTIVAEPQTLAELVPGDELLQSAQPAGELEVRSAEERLIGARLVGWDSPGETPIGIESFRRGSFAHIDPRKVVLRLEHEGPAAGRGETLEERADGPWMTFRVSKTPRGDELLTLAKDGVTRHVSVSYHPRNTLAEIGHRNGQRTVAITRTDLREVSTTWKPIHQSADVLFVRAEPEAPKENHVTAATAPDAPAATPAAPVIDITPLAGAIDRLAALQERSQQEMADRIARLEERGRADFALPGPTPVIHKASLGDWGSVALRMLKGQPISRDELQQRALDDIITPDNPGLVPDALRPDLLIGTINPRRPFLVSCTQIDAPETGMSIQVPVIQQHSTAAVQASEKTEVESTAFKVTVADFPAKSIFGAADVSVQMIRRADRSFMSLLMRDLGRAYARNADSQALAALFTAGTTPGTGNIDPEDLTIGEAWENSMDACEEPPDTIWLSKEGVKAFMNAKDDGANKPLYFSLNAAFKVGTGPGGEVSALRPIYVPALDAYDVDVMIGPSAGFAWAEEAPIELTADKPAVAGRDIALGGIIFFVPRYSAAFTTYEIGS